MSIPQHYIPCKNKNGESHEKGTLPRSCEACLDYLNACCTLLEVTYDYEGNLDESLNMKSGAARLGPFVHELDQQQLFIFLKRLQAITAEVAHLYTQRLVQEKISDPNILRKVKDPNEFKKAVAAQRLAQRVPRERKHLSDLQKAIDGMMKIPGVTEDQARKIVEKQFKQQGKAIK